MTFIPTDYADIQKKIQAQKENNYWGGYYKPGVYGGTPTQKKMFSGRILPAFNYELSTADANFASSWIPYRNVNNIDEQTNQPVLNAFFAVVAAYSWFGNKQVSFLSPSTLRFTHSISRGPELIDPVQDIRNFARKHEDPAIRALTERPANVKDAKIIIPYAQRRYVFNFYGTAGSDRTQRNYLVDVSQKAFEDLAGKLSEWRPSHEQPLDNNWPNYLYGDITDPNNGVMVDTVAIPSNPQPFNGFIFTSGSHKSTKGVRQCPVPTEALTGRYQLYGDASVFKIMQAQEIVEFLVEDGAIPYHLIQEVCGNYCNVPPPPKNQKVFVGNDSLEENFDSYVPPVVNPFNNTFKPSNNAPPAPPKVDSVKEKKYWLSCDGRLIADKLLTKEEVQKYVMDNPVSNFMVNKEGSSEWNNAIDEGFSVPPKPSAPPTPPAVSQTKPSAAPTPAPFSLPELTPSVAPVIQKTAPAEKTSAVEVSEEEAAAMEDIRVKFEKNIATTAEISKYMQYLQRTNAIK